MFAPGAMAWAHSTSMASSDLPVPVAGVGGKRRSARLVEHFQRRVRRVDVELLQAELAAEAVGVGEDVGIVVGVDDGDRLTGAGARPCRRNGNLVDAVGRLHLGRIDRSHAAATRWAKRPRTRGSE